MIDQRKFFQLFNERDQRGRGKVAGFADALTQLKARHAHARDLHKVRQVGAAAHGEHIAVMIDDDVVIQADDACHLPALGDVDAHAGGEDIADLVDLQIGVFHDVFPRLLQVRKEHMLPEPEPGKLRNVLRGIGFVAHHDDVAEQEGIVHRRNDGDEDERAKDEVHCHALEKIPALFLALFFCNVDGVLALRLLGAALALGRVHGADGLRLIDVDARGGAAAGAENAGTSAGETGGGLVRAVKQVDLLGQRHAAQQVAIIRQSAAARFPLSAASGGRVCAVAAGGIGQGGVVRNHPLAILPDEAVRGLKVLLLGVFHLVVAEQVDQLAVLVHRGRRRALRPGVIIDLVFVVELGIVIDAVLVVEFGIVIDLVPVIPVIFPGGSVVQQAPLVLQLIRRRKQRRKQAESLFLIRLVLFPALLCHGSPRVV